MSYYETSTRNIVGSLVGEFQMQVLEAIAVLGSDAFGANIKRRLEDLSTREVHTPQVYAALKRLEHLGLVNSTVDEDASAGKRGRSRRVYELAASGQRMLDAGMMLSDPMQGSGDIHASASKGLVTP